VKVLAAASTAVVKGGEVARVYSNVCTVIRRDIGNLSRTVRVQETNQGVEVSMEAVVSDAVAGGSL
jgi:hypothetical protein